MQRSKVKKEDKLEIIIYKDTFGELILVCGVVVEDQREPDFLYINPKIRIVSCRLVDSIAINKKSLVFREVINVAQEGEDLLVAIKGRLGGGI